MRHGSTVATNTLLERKGARVVMLTNRGFEDLLEIGRQDRPDLLCAARRGACRRSSRGNDAVGVRARRGPDGRAQVPLADAEVRRAIARAASAS